MQTSTAWGCARARSGADAGSDEAERGLVARIAGGDCSALADLYTRHARPLLAYLAALTPDHGLAEEVLQEHSRPITTPSDTGRGSPTG